MSVEVLRSVVAAQRELMVVLEHWGQSDLRYARSAAVAGADRGRREPPVDAGAPRFGVARAPSAV